MEKDLDEQYDLKASLKEIGVLYPAIADKKGQIIDGKHRLAADSRWPIFVLEDIDTDEKYLRARIIANTHRRKVPAEEKAEWLDELAEKTEWTPEKIAKKVGMSGQWVLKYLSDKYKVQTRAEAGRASGKARAEKAKNLFHGVEQKSSFTPVADEPVFPNKPEMETFSTPQPSKFEAEAPLTVVTRDPRLRYIEGMQLWFIPPSDPVMTALYHYCVENEVHWHVAVRNFLGKCLEEEGFLEEKK